MSFDDPVADSLTKHLDSLECTTKLSSLLQDGFAELPVGCDLDFEAKVAIKMHHRNALNAKTDSIYSLTYCNHSIMQWN